MGIVMSYELYIEPIRGGTNKGKFKKNGIRKYLSKEEVQQVIEMYPYYFNWQLAYKFDVSESNILSIRRKYNLSKSQEIVSKMRFQKGHGSFNKGRKHPHDSRTKFKKGNIPANHKEIGSKRVTKDGYYEIKIAEPNKWEALHRHTWKQHHGEIPKGMIIIFKDGNPLNADISNLQMISRRENMERNRNRKKASESMRELWHREKLRAIYGLRRETKLRIGN
jgi:hypothetical protein